MTSRCGGAGTDTHFKSAKRMEGKVCLSHIPRRCMSATGASAGRIFREQRMGHEGEWKGHPKGGTNKMSSRKHRGRAQEHGQAWGNSKKRGGKLPVIKSRTLRGRLRIRDAWAQETLTTTSHECQCPLATLAHFNAFHHIYKSHAHLSRSACLS